MMSRLTDPVELPFVLEGVRIAPRALPIAPELSLCLMQDDYPDDALQEADSARLMDKPPYWAFCWGGGQALARWILDHPSVVAGRRVVDFGAGSGVAGIAAAKSGAQSIVAVDIDPDALAICAINARLNEVPIGSSTLLGKVEDELLLAADVCYEEAGFSGVLERILAGGDVIVAESRMRDLSERFPQLNKVAQYRVRTFPDLNESENYDLVHIFCSYQLVKTL
jgi:predicted nicotinamide N-methyase